MPVGRPKNETGIELNCPKCDHTWKTNARGIYATCPRCRKNVRIPNRTIADLKMMDNDG